MASEEPKASAGHVFVIGMHRSGTSALCEGLVRLGLRGPQAPQGEAVNRWNPHGYFEDPELRACNDALLEAAGVFWYAPPVEGLPALMLPQSLRARMAAYLESATRVHKDPRLCLTLPYWQPLPARSTAVLIWRHPDAVAHSLQRRDGMPLPVGRLLWETYTRLALGNMGAMPRILVAQEQLLTEPRKVFEGLETWLRSKDCLAGHGNVGEAAAAIDAELAQDRRDDERLSESQRSLLEALRAGRMDVPETPPSAVDAQVLLDVYVASGAGKLSALKREFGRLEAQRAQLELEARSYRHIMNKPLVRAWMRVKGIFSADPKPQDGSKGGT